MQIAAARCRAMAHLKSIVDELWQESMIFELKTGVNFEKCVYFPENSPITGEPQLYVEDNPHKLKNLGTAIKR